MHANDSVKFLGNSDDVTTCECCGRKNLKSTVALSINDGEAVYFGVTCAARALAMDAALVRKASKAQWDAFLKAHGTGDCVFTRIQSLGGYPAARALFATKAA